MKQFAVLSLGLVIGCAAPAYERRLAADHPANPSADTMPLPPPSTTLAQHAAPAPSGDPLERVVSPSKADGHAGHGGHEHHGQGAPQTAPATAPAHGGHRHE